MRLRLLYLAAATVLVPVPATSQQAVTAADYARAERFLGAFTNAQVFGATVDPTWTEGGKFWYRNTTPDGAEFVTVDPRRGTRARAFDHDRLATALSSAAGSVFTGMALPFTSFAYVNDEAAIAFTVGPRRFTCDIMSYRCSADPRSPEPNGDRSEVVSPDGRRAVYIQDHNLWVRDMTSGESWQLTRDGVEDFGYGTNNAGWTKSDRPVVLWSPDSKKLATFQHDARGVGDMYLVSTNVGHPTLEAWKYPLPEDSVIFRIHRVVIDVDAGDVVRLQMPPDQHRSTICDHIVCRGQFSDVEWNGAGTDLYFVSSSRDHKEAKLRTANARSGVVREILDESVETFFESGFNAVNWRSLPETNEIIWYSQRSDWGHLYLYDARTGRLKNRITSGNWNVLQLLKVDEANRMLYFTGAGREPGDPYFQYFYKVKMDGSDLTLLTPDSATHVIDLSPDGQYFVDRWSTPTTPPTTVVRDLSGRHVVDVERADISQLLASGWQPPIPFTVKARDGVTDLYGLLYRPTRFDPSRSYPVLNYVYPGPQTGSVGSRNFSAARSDKQALAELGFVVVEVDAMGTPMRSKSFHAAYYGDMGDNGIPDQVTTIKQLGARFPWMDLDRVGIWGHSGGGFASTAGILTYPDFYKVAVSQAGNHDNRNYEDDWGEKWQGLLVENADGSTNYDNQANQLKVANLKGKLLLAHGTMDNNVPPSNTMVVVDALIAANKNFDLILFPNRRHGFGNEPYMMRRRWDYFVEHLLGVDPPAEFEFQSNRRR